MAINEERLHALLGKGVTDFGAMFFGALVVIGDELGLYKAMAERGPTTAADLAQRTDTTERYVREWLCANAAAGYVDYEPAHDLFSLSEEQAFVLANESGPAFLPAAFQVALAATKAVPRVVEGFRTGSGVGWGEHHPDLFRGTERFFRPGYAANLVSTWIPALDGAEAKLQAGAVVADIGCGHGASTVLMAKSYPKSRFVGFDYHGPSIEYARTVAAEAGVSDRVSFQVAGAKDYPGDGYDFVAFFDCLHDMGDPVGACRHVLETVKNDATVMIVEPFAHDKVEENINPIGRAFYSASTLICTPCSLSQEVGLALGAQAGEARMRDVVTSAGFTRFRRATETPFNLIYEARP